MVATVAAVVVSLIGCAQAHDWYPAECCEGLDCSPAKPGAVEFTPLGWKIVRSGELIRFSDPRLRVSPDRQFHRCLMNFWEPEGETRCLFVPPPDD